MKKIIFQNPLAPGDILVSTCAIRDLHKAYPGEYLTDIRCPTGAEQIFENNPYITKIEDNDPEAERIRLDYSDIHNSGWSGRPFTTAHSIDLAKKLGCPIPHTTLMPDIFLSQDEKLWPPPVLKECGYDGKYWIINAGVKNDYTLKYYPHYQEVVDLLKDEIQFVQVGQLEHNHTPLAGALDMRGKTNLRELFRLSYHAEGAVSAVSLQMVVMAAFQKPCVVVAGAREPIRWQHIPNHRFLAVNGSIECALYDGCWKSKLSDCVNKTDFGKGGPLCMEMIRPEDIVRAIRLYYIGGVLKTKEKVYA
jgi:ADP-heptose:LPS heptosyltransferase